MIEAETTIPNPAIQSTIVGQRPTVPMPGATRAPPYKGAHFKGPPSSVGWEPTTAPPQHMHMQMSMQNYPTLHKGLRLLVHQVLCQTRWVAGHMQNPISLSQLASMPPYSQ